MQQQIMEEILDAQAQGGLGIALLAVGLVNQDAQAGSFVESIVIIDVDAADGGAAIGHVNHQAELLLRRYVVVVQQKLLYLKAGIWRMCATHPPDVTVVFPAVDPLGVFWLGATQCDDVIFDEHSAQSLDILCFSCRLAQNLINLIR